MSDERASDTEWQLDAVLRLFDHIESQVRLADQKAGLLFAAIWVLLAGILPCLTVACLINC